MINNKNKIAVVFGVRNDSSIAHQVTLKLHQSGCKVILNYVDDTKADVLFLMKQNGMDSAFTAHVDVRNENKIKNFLSAIYEGFNH